MLTKIKLFDTIVIAALMALAACNPVEVRHESKTESPIRNVRDENGKTSEEPPPVVVTSPPAVATPPTQVPNLPPPMPILSNHETPKLGIILGPGALRTFAHIGVLKEFARARIPINSIIGLEWGALIAGLYSVQGQVNEVEFKALRMRENDLPGRGLLASRVKAEPTSVFSDYLGQMFGNALFDKGKVEFACPTYTPSTSKLTFLGRGAIRDGLSKCLAYPPYFLPNHGTVAAPFVVEEAAAFLRARNINLVIFVNVLSSGDLFPNQTGSEYQTESVLFEELRRELSKGKFVGVNYVLNVPTPNVTIIDFESRNRLMEQGATAAKDLVSKLVSQYGF